MPLCIENLSYSPQINIKLINNVSYTFKEGHIYSIIGRSGSGKTTFLKTLNNLIPFEGIIKYNDKNILDFYPPHLRTTILYIPQQPVLFGNTFEEDLKVLTGFNIFKTRPNKLSSLNDCLNLFNLDKNVINKKATDLSGGEKQRLGLIKSMLIDPEVFLFDEPTAALDMYTEDLFIKALATISNDKIIINVSHSITVINNSDIKLLFNSGKIVKEKNDIIVEDFLKNFLTNG
jgi:putative ABC transport system ATP-binding protein